MNIYRNNQKKWLLVEKSMQNFFFLDIFKQTYLLQIFKDKFMLYFAIFVGKIIT